VRRTIDERFAMRRFAVRVKLGLQQLLVFLAGRTMSAQKCEPARITNFTRHFTFAKM
jgi:hypothetical protein